MFMSDIIGNYLASKSTKNIALSQKVSEFHTPLRIRSDSW